MLYPLTNNYDDHLVVLGGDTLQLKLKKRSAEASNVLTRHKIRVCKNDSDSEKEMK